MDKGLKDAFKGAKEAAQKIAQDTEATEKLLEQAQEKAGKNKKFAQKLRGELHSLFRMVKQWSKGNYKAPFKSIVMALAAIAYFVNPLDLIPDFLIGTGLLDDATVIAYALKMIRKDIREFLSWEESTHKQGDSE